MKHNKNKIVQPIEKGVAKVPVVMQLEFLECGAACLTMVLAYYEKWIPLEKVREVCGVSRDGSNAKNILMAARSFGLSSKGYKLEPQTLKEKGIFPCIVHWEFNHFIVVNGFKNGRVYINDPARGDLAITEEQFDEGYTGICLFFEPTEDFVPEGKAKSIKGFAMKRMKGAFSALIFMFITSLIVSVFGIVKPGFSRIFIDELLDGNSIGYANVFFILLIGFSLLELIVSWISEVSNLRINGKLAVEGNTTYMWKVLRLPMEFFSQRMAGDIQQRKESNAMIAGTLVNTFAPLLLNTGMLIFYFVVMVRYSIVLTAIGVFSIVMNYYVGKIISKKRINITRALMRDEGKLYGTTISGIEMMETIKSSGAENGFFQKWSGYQASVNNGEVKYSKLNSYLGAIPQIISVVSGNIVLIAGIYLTFNDNFTVGMVMAFQGFLASFVAPAMQLINASQMITEMRTQMERIEDVMEYPVDVDEDYDICDEDTEYAKLTGRVELINVTFGYAPLAEPIIKDFSMKVEPGKKVAFVGGSGCGKSTLSKLISGLYKPWSGQILIDGKPIDEINRDVLRGSLAVVDQDVILFEDTISENIKMWDSSIADFEVILAARDANLHDDIMQKTGGYSHKLLEGGKDFSGGQKQRMEIARVLAQDPTIIIMDEATSALDARTEYEVVNSIRERGITSIVIAHRLSTIRDCDEIIVLDRGVVVERGTHDELIAKGGYYTTLVTSE